MPNIVKPGQRWRSSSVGLAAVVTVSVLSGSRSAWGQEAATAPVAPPLAPNGVADINPPSASSLLSKRRAFTPQGPIPTRNLDPLNTPFLLPVPTAAQVLGRGGRRLELNLEMANNFYDQRGAGGRAYVTDFEEQRLTVAYARGVGERQEWAVRVPLIARNRGLFDKIIDSYDRLINQRGSGRDKAPDFRDIYNVTDAQGNAIINRQSAQVGIGDTNFEYRYQLTPPAQSGQQHVLTATLRGLAKLPTASKSDLLGSGAFDFGAGLAVSWQPARRLALHGNVTPVFLGKPHINNLQTRREVTHLMGAAEYMLGHSTSFLLQTDYNPLPARNLFSIHEPRKSLTLGLWHQADARKSYFASFTENKLGPFGTENGAAPDIALSFGMRFNR